MLKYLTAILLLCFTVNLSGGVNDPKPTLYYSDTCGHCTKVLNYLRQNPHSVTMKNISNQTYRSELQAMGFRGVPVLIAGSDRRSGADSIISYFRSHSE